MATKTLFLFEEVPESSYFFELEGDYSHLHETYINGSDDTVKVNELSGLVYRSNEEIEAFEKANPEITDSRRFLKISKLEAPTKDWTHFVKCGMVL